MKDFVEKYADNITGTLSCFDRVLFKGHLNLNYSAAVTSWLSWHDVLIKDFPGFAKGQSEFLKKHAQDTAAKAERPYIYLGNRRERKEALVHKILRENPIAEGLICVLGTLEICPTYKVIYGKDYPRLKSVRRQSLCMYFYYVDREFGFMYVRLQTWVPFTVQIYVNGHEWLRKKLDRHSIEHLADGNCFMQLPDCQRAQRFADRFAKKNWPRVLHTFAQRVNPLLRGVLAGHEYYWVTDQAEYATDILFTDPAALSPTYQQLLKHAITNFSAEDVMGFLGKKLHVLYQGEVVSSYNRRWPGARIKHRSKRNTIKMYDKNGSVLRIETVINQPTEFRVRRRGKRKGEEVIDWFPLPKGVAYLSRYQEISRAANQRYLQALAAVDLTSLPAKSLNAIARTVTHQNRNYRGFNPALAEDVNLFRFIMRAEYTINGFRNADIRRQIYADTNNTIIKRRQSARVCRILKRLHLHKIIAKIPRSHRWRITKKGWSILSVVLNANFQPQPQEKAANE